MKTGIPAVHKKWKGFAVVIGNPAMLRSMLGIEMP